MRPPATAAFLVSLLLANFSTLIDCEKPVRKRHVKKNLASIYEREKVEVVFGRFVEEDLSYSFSYSFSYPDLSTITSSPSSKVSINPTQMLADDVAPASVPFPSEAPKDSVVTVSPTLSPTSLALSPTTDSSESKVIVTNAPTTFDTISNDAAPATSSPTGNDQDPGITVEINSNTEIDTNDEEKGISAGKAYIAPVVGIVAGALVIGVAVRAIDRRTGPTQYINLDADSQSSFSLEA